MAKKRRKRSMNLGLSTSEHRAEMDRYASQVQSQIQSLERNPGGCHSMFLALTSIEHTLGKAAAHNASKGSQIRPGRTSKRKVRRYTAFRNLTDRLDKLSQQFENTCLVS